MLVIVARSSTDSDSTASPQYSTSFPIARPLFTYGWRRISSMKSFAVTLSGFLPRTTTLTVSGTVSRTSFVIQELKIAVVPTPKATRSEEHTSELQSRLHLVCRLLLEKKNNISQQDDARGTITVVLNRHDCVVH